VIVVGGGPGGSTLAWDLARQGVAVTVLERTRFPREKVCGDYVEPRGLRILERMGTLERLETGGPLRITHSAIYVDGECRYRGEIPFYGPGGDLPQHGYIIARDELDDAMLRTAAEAGATVHEETRATAVDLGTDGVAVDAKRAGRAVRYRGRLVVGADGVNSVVARGVGLAVDDPRYVAVAQRAYATVSDDVGEAAFFFDHELFPGYGWVFPLAGGRVNLGVGILSETRQKLGLQVPELFAAFVAGLGDANARWRTLELCAPPIGGIVRTYGAAGPNHFDGGVLVGDAGGFVDPMTGEGITPAMESALLASPVLRGALDVGRFDAAQLQAYETAFRAHFDPAMIFLDLCAATLRNRHLAGPWLKALARGCELASSDPDFARTGGAYFGGLDVRPFGILGQMWLRVVEDLALAWPRSLTGAARGTTLTDLFGWQAALLQSLLAEPLWHTRWAADVQRKWLRVLAPGARGEDPRYSGVASS
jgi:geranylgeranyl reductase family protein